MPRCHAGFHQDGVQESPELIERCLNCTLPAEKCNGKKNCAAYNEIGRSAERKARDDTIRYARSKGYTFAEIHELLGVSDGTIINAIYG